ncbi:substrate-binding domain-containing protein [Dictyobacter halimunensis]
MDARIKSFDVSDLQIPKQRRSEQARRTNARVTEVCERLRSLASELGPGNRLPTIRELCSRLNTSSATLTTALDLLENEQLFYRKERQGIFVSDLLLKRSVHIVFNNSLIANNAASPFWSLLCGRLALVAEQRAKSKNEHISFHFLWRDMPQPIPDEHIALLNSPSVDGSLIIGFNAHSFEHVSLLSKPHVVFAGGGDWMVQYDEATSARLAADVLVRKNCQRIGYWSAKEEDPTSPFDQAHYFYQALQQQHFPVDRAQFRAISGMSTPMRRPLTSQERGYLLVKDVFGSAQEERPDGIYISDDLVTDGALVAFDELGIHVGQDVHLVSLANTDSPILFGRTQNITLLEQDSEELVRGMFSLLESLLNGMGPTQQSVYIQPHLREV